MKPATRKALPYRILAGLAIVALGLLAYFGRDTITKIVHPEHKAPPISKAHRKGGSLAKGAPAPAGSAPSISSPGGGGGSGNGGGSAPGGGQGGAPPGTTTTPPVVPAKPTVNVQLPRLPDTHVCVGKLGGVNC